MNTAGRIRLPYGQLLESDLETISATTNQNTTKPSANHLQMVPAE